MGHPFATAAQTAAAPGMGQTGATFAAPGASSASPFGAAYVAASAAPPPYHPVQSPFAGGAPSFQRPLFTNAGQSAAAPPWQHSQPPPQPGQPPFLTGPPPPSFVPPPSAWGAPGTRMPDSGSRQRAETIDASGRRSRGRQRGMPKRTYARCGGCGGWKWHDLIDSAKCRCGRKWPQDDINACARQTYWRAHASGEDPPPWTVSYVERAAPSSGSARGSRGGGGSNGPSGTTTPRASSDVAAPAGPALGISLATLQRASEAGLLHAGDGSLIRLPADIVITEPPPTPAAAPAPVSTKEAKAAAERHCQQSQKAQRVALAAVQSAEADADAAQQRLQAKTCLLDEARKQLSVASAVADSALVAFNDASKAYQAEVAALAVPSTAKAKAAPTGGNAGSRAGSSSGVKRAAPEENADVVKAWDTLRTRCQDALNVGDEEGFRAAAARCTEELFELRKQALAAREAPPDPASGRTDGDDVGGDGGLPDAAFATDGAAAVAHATGEADGERITGQPALQKQRVAGADEKPDDGSLTPKS